MRQVLIQDIFLLPTQASLRSVLLSRSVSHRQRRRIQQQ